MKRATPPIGLSQASETSGMGGAGMDLLVGTKKSNPRYGAYRQGQSQDTQEGRLPLQPKVK